MHWPCVWQWPCSFGWCLAECYRIRSLHPYGPLWLRNDCSFLLHTDSTVSLVSLAWACVQFPVLADNLCLNFYCACFEVNFSDIQEGLTVSFIICDRWLHCVDGSSHELGMTHILLWLGWVGWFESLYCGVDVPGTYCKLLGRLGRASLVVNNVM